MQAIKFFSIGKTADESALEEEDSLFKKQLMAEEEVELKQAVNESSSLKAAKNGITVDIDFNVNGRIVDKDGEVNELMVSEKGVKFCVDGEKALANFDELLLKKAKIKQVSSHSSIYCVF